MIVVVVAVAYFAYYIAWAVPRRPGRGLLQGPRTRCLIPTGQIRTARDDESQSHNSKIFERPPGGSFYKKQNLVIQKI